MHIVAWTTNRFGIAAGVAMLSAPGPAPCTPADVERLFEGNEGPVEVGAVCRS